MEFPLKALLSLQNSVSPKKLHSFLSYKLDDLDVFLTWKHVVQT